MSVRILVMGLPGAGKTYLAQRLKEYLETHSDFSTMPSEKLINYESPPLHYKSTVEWFNADEIRKKFNDWDFSNEGRIRQSLRMAQFALACKSDYVICDFVAPLPEMRHNFKADWVIWMDSVELSKYQDTNKMFVPPDIYDFRITELNAEKWIPFIGEHILHNERRPTFSWNKPTVQMLGRWQPWHKGHRALFERAIKKTGQVCVMVRDCHGTAGNPFTISQVTDFIKRDLDPEYQGMYTILPVPNITNITYGRDVGYTIEQELFEEAITSISATNIRKMMGIK